ncbi:MAG: HypC/HybG/HupF family hydrogenase formation chaperone [Clostridiales bacterium]|nr:HypC/HybG/HupF family hydrogenase formation chaperone [Clostridiales bacterium]
MCVGLSAKVVSVKGDVALVDSSGARREVSAALLDDLEPGEFVMVHAGAAIARITSDDITESEDLAKEYLS